VESYRLKAVTVKPMFKNHILQSVIWGYKK